VDMYMLSRSESKSVGSDIESRSR